MVNGMNSNPRLSGKRMRGRKGKHGGLSRRGHQQQPLHQVVVAVALRLAIRIVTLESALPKLENHHHQSATPNVRTWTQMLPPNHQQRHHHQLPTSSSRSGSGSESPNGHQYPPGPGTNNNNRNSSNLGHQHHLHHNYHRQRHRRRHSQGHLQMPHPGRQQVKVITRRT